MASVPRPEAELRTGPRVFKYQRSARVTPANAITMLRMLATPFMVVLIVVLGPSWANVAVWVVLASTDFLDGWVARREGPTTSGAFLDPLADKALVLGALAALAGSGRVSWVPVVIIAAREVAMSLYRSARSRGGVSIPARPLAKAKTATQDLAVGLILIPAIGRHHPAVGREVLWVAVLLAVVSFGQYLADGRSGAVRRAGRP
ncbi:CDP-alcohol phosphatidyltransferase family protein [Acidiferrimicrobium sp. IK]|uniref:CDP-alcohol phosphatidyltransferase family protein n=1 Tax=Acidiferrimicrobium sp. IK TaxID=2871700 RepID=UPI0021CB17FF|nr:CDP-alcohol phosphatidyltransferase family protein [Acidiferrimicrobium sp. IK]MCU4183725.1 CDP-alcohol phosphatidyltransferase family protein [Acidiferrimicrobium sp. IK]